MSEAAGDGFAEFMISHTFCKFPEHIDEKWTDVVEEDRDYVEWLVSGEGPEMSDSLYDFLMELLEVSNG